MSRLVPLIAIGLCAAAAGCASVAPARMALPAGLAAAPAEPFEGASGARSGQLRLAGEEIWFVRQADRVSLFDRLVLDRVSLRVDRPTETLRCDGSRAEGRAGTLQAPLRPLTIVCRHDGTGAAMLTVREVIGAAAGTRDARDGVYEADGLTLIVESVHTLQGSPLPLAQPAGYVLRQGGRVLAAIELTGSTPVLRRASGLAAPQGEAVTRTALALGLLFDPATLGP